MRLEELDADIEHLRESEVEGRQAWRGTFLDVRRDRVALPDGSGAYREYIVHPGAVMIVAILDDGRLVVERQWRYPLHRAMLEFPAGKIEVGEPPLQCAARELEEETGYRAAEWAHAGVLHNAIAYSNEASRSSSHAAWSRARAASTPASSSMSSRPTRPSSTRQRSAASSRMPRR
jgi:ADP-ribose pyrophosphatase YjhB (NUDIX family)